MATIYEVSELAGVSLATVSRVMNKNARVSDKTREKVLKAMEQLGYRPNSIAQSLASSRSNSVGILISELKGYFYGEMMAGIEAELRDAEKHVIIAAGHSDAAEEKDGIEFLIDRRCDALILHVEAVSDEYLIELNKGDTPIILINRFVPQLADNCICVDNEMGGYLAAKALIENGHRNFAYISGPLWKTDATDRSKGVMRALNEHKITLNPLLTHEGSYQEPSGVEGMNKFLSYNIPFTALICANDEMASGAMVEAREQGLNVPDDISIVGFDNATFARYMYPQLSTINNPVNTMGHMAARWILKHTYQLKNLQIQHLYAPEFISRNSIKKIN